MEIPKKFFHDRIVLFIVTILAVMLVVSVSWVLIRFDPSKNPTTIVAYRPNITGSSYQSGKPLDIYVLALFMLFTSIAGVFLSAQVYNLRRQVSIFILTATASLLLLSFIVSNALISLQ